MKTVLAATTALVLSTPALVAVPGCDSKEDVLEIETPGRSIDVERDNETIDVDLDDK